MKRNWPTVGMLLIALLLIFSGCDTNGGVQGGGTNGAGYGRVKIGVPF